MDLNQKRMKTTIMTIFTIFLMIFSSLIINSVSNQNGPDNEVTPLVLDEAPPSDPVINRDYQEMDNNIQSGLGTRSRYLEHTIHLDDPAVQLTVQSGDAYDTSYGNNIRSGTAIAAGDIDNDGFEDLILGCPFADGALENRWNTGQVMVIFGGTQTHPNTIFDQAKAIPGEIDITIHGADNNDLFGGAVVCGNVDGDAYDDIIITAPYGDSFSNSRNDAGEIYVIYGAARDKLESEIDLRSTEPDILIFGAKNSDLAGFSIAIGDVIGDSKSDIIIGAKLADPEGRNNAGMVYIIAGNTRGNFGKTIDLDVLSGRGSRGNPDVRIDGVNPNDRAGFAVAAGDVNGDGRDDVLIGARYAQYNSSWDNTGVTYVIYGQQTLPNKLNLTLDADVYIYGRDSHDNSGWALATGDINGDMYDEIIIGAPYADGFNNGQRDAGEIYIIYGSGSLPQNIYTRLDEHDVIAYGIDAWDNFGFSLTTGSVDGDKYADLIMGARGGNGEFNGKGDCGDNYLIMVNATSTFGDDIDLITESSTIIYGIDSGDNSGRFLHFGDLDGDGLEDILMGGPYADGPDNARDSCGEFYVIYSAPPPVSNDWLNLIDGDQNDKTIFTRYRPYTFRVNVSNILGYKDFKTVTLSIDPQGYNISYRWIREANEFEKVRDTYAFAECVSGIIDVKHDGLYNYSIDFKMNFNWNISLEDLIDCQVATECILSFPDTDTYSDVFEVNNEVIFKGDLKLEGAAQGKLNPGDWVAGTEKITFSGLTVAYNSTDNYYPPKTEYSLGIGTPTKMWPVTPAAPGIPFTATITTPAETSEYFYQPQILGIPTENDESNINFTLQVDNDPPAPPSALTIKADSMNDIETVEVDNDDTIFVSWPEAFDSGSGINGYYYGFTDNSGTDDGLWTEETNSKLVDAAEGQNAVHIWSSDNVGNIGPAISGQIFIDLTEATFDNFAPVTDNWLSSNQVACSIQVFDQDGYGVDIENITYLDMTSKKWMLVNIDMYDNQSFYYANVSAVTELPDGTEGFIQFRAVDRAGNGPAESDKYYFKIDTTPVIFSDTEPIADERQTNPRIRCYVTLADSGSGVDISTIQYSYTTNGLENYTNWLNSGLAIVANPNDPEISSTWFIDLTFARGGDNYIRWRAKDLAGNGYTVSENYSVWVNAVPEIIIEGVEENGVYEMQTFLEFNAENTVDSDNTLQDKNFVWQSNITGDFGTGKIVVTSLPAGRHHITLSVFDGQNYAKKQFNITVLAPKAPDKDEDLGVFGISKNADSVIFGLIILIIIIVLLFMVVFLREKKIRKKLEERALGSGIATMAKFRPGVMARDSPQLVGPGGPRVIGAGGDEVVPITSLKGPQQLPAVGGTEAEEMESTQTQAPTTIGRQLPQLPPARIKGYPFPQRKPDMKLDIDTRKKMELLEKKMLVGEIPVELYEKLSKKYEEELKQPKETKTDEAESPEEAKSEKPNEPIVAPKPVIAGVGVTPVKQEKNDQAEEKAPEPESEQPEIKPVIPKPVTVKGPKPTVTQQPTLGLTPDVLEQEKDQENKIDIEPAPPELQVIPEPEAEKSEPPKKKKKKKKKKTGFEEAQGFTEDELEFLRKLKKGN